MILDYVSKIERYGCLNENFVKVGSFLKEHDINELPEGTTEIDGENAYIKVFGYELADTQNVWEAHRTYADIHIILSGEEGIGYCPEFEVTAEAFDSPDAEDVLFSDIEGQLAGLTPGQFAVLLPGEVHRPGVLMSKETRKVKKAVVKVLCEE